jgi:enterochelin esterase-like enzyme
MTGGRAGTYLALLSIFATAACSRREPVGARAGSKSNDAVGVGQSVVTARATVPELAQSATRAEHTEVSGAERAPSRLVAEERTWVFEPTEIGRMVAVALLPARDPATRWPVLLAFHGRGEALKGPDRGARGWIDDYALGRALARLAAPPLTHDDFESFVAPERLRQLNASLKARPFRGLVVVCSYTPDMLRGDRPLEKVPPLARFVTTTLLPRIQKDLPVLGASATGIDGVSLGGRAAFGVGLLAPRSFRAIAGLQAAFDVDDAEELATRAQQAYAENSGLVFRLLTSTGDFFREADTAIARAMQARGLPAQLDLVEGPHDYAFNRGPGAIEMLVYHDRVLRGEAPL